MNTKICLFLLVAVFTVVLISNATANPAEENSALLSRSKRDLAAIIADIKEHIEVIITHLKAIAQHIPIHLILRILDILGGILLPLFIPEFLILFLLGL